MNKILFTTLILLLVSCAKEDPNTSPYSENQQKAIALFSGTWVDTIYTFYGADRIVFGSKYETPINGKHGECLYEPIEFPSLNRKSIECYYEVSSLGDELIFYKKSDNSVCADFEMRIISTTKISLKISYLSQANIFVKI